MKHHQLQVLLVSWLVPAATAPAAIRYVDVNSSSPTSLFTNWAIAATIVC